MQVGEWPHSGVQRATASDTSLTQRAETTHLHRFFNKSSVYHVAIVCLLLACC